MLLVKVALNPEREFTSFFFFSKRVHHSRSTRILEFSVAVLTLFAFPHVVGNPVCLVLF